MHYQALDRYKAGANLLASRIDELRAIAMLMDREVDADVLLREANRLHGHRFQVVVIGEFSRGKSTLVNALIGRKLLPAKLRPTTAALTHIRHGDEVRVQVIRSGGVVHDLPVDQIATVVTGEGAAGVERVDVSVPCPWLADGVELIDTPGVNDLSRAREDVTLKFLPSADLAVFVLDAKACFSDSERAFLARDVIQANLARVFFVINKVDQVDGPNPSAEVVGLLDRVRVLTRGLVTSPRVFAVAARPALEAQGRGEAPVGTGVLELTEALSRFLATERGEALLKRAGASADAAASRLAEGIAVRLAALEGARQASQGVLEAVSAEADRNTLELTRLRAGWSATVTAIADDVRASVRRRASDVARRLAGSFDGAMGPLDLDAVRAAVGHEFLAIAEESQTRLQQTIAQQAQRVAADLSSLESSARRLVVTAGSDPLIKVGVESPVVTPASALVAAGAMGVAAAMSVATGGVLVVGALAFLAVRASEQENTHAVARRHFDRLIGLATDHLCAALAQQANELGEATWNDLGGAVELRAAEGRRAVQEARADLERTGGARAAESRRLRALSERLLDARAGVSRAVLDGLAALESR